MPKYVAYNYPAVKWVAVFSAGITLAYYFSVAFQIWIVGMVVLIALFVAAKSVQSRIKRYRIRSIISHLLLLSIGGLLFSSHVFQKEGNKEYAQRIADSAEEVKATFSILESKPGREGYRYVGRIDSLISPAGWKVSGEIKIYLIHQSDSLQLKPGSVANIAYRAFEMPKATNPYQFDFSAWLESQGIYLSAIITQIDRASIDVDKSSIGYWRSLADDQLKNITTEESYPIAKALVMGNKSELSYDEKRNFSRSGMAHLMAVSGLHVGFVVAPFLLILPWCRYHSVRRLAFLSLMFLVLSCYAALTGFSASVLRSSLMVLLFVGGSLWLRQINAVNITAFSALILLIWNPAYLFDVGFQLSYTAVFVILLLFPPVDAWLKSKIDSKIPRWIASSALLAIVVQIGLYPLLSYHFFEFSVVSPITNIFALFPTAYIVGGGLIGVIFGGHIPWVDQLLKLTIDNLTHFLGWMSGLMSNELSYIHSARPGIVGFILWGILIWVFIARNSKKYRVKSWIAGLSALFLLVASSLTNHVSDKLELLFFDVGQGDAAIIHTPDDHHLLIDTGVWSPSFDSGSSIIVPYLKARGISKLDAIFLTHPHADHVGGTEAILDAIEVDSVFLSNQVYESNLHERIQLQLDSLHIPHRFFEAGDYVAYSDLSVYGLWPPSIYDDTNVNNESTVLMINYGEEKFLFTGDIEAETEEMITNIYSDMLKSDLLKVGHHGSKSSSTLQFLNAADPEIAIVSNGYRNRYRHPHGVTTNRLLAHDTDVYYTALQGAVYARSDGDTTLVVPYPD